MDNSVTTHAGARVMTYGNLRIIAEVHVDEKLRKVTVRCSPAYAILTGSFARQVGCEMGWPMGRGASSYSFGTGHANSVSASTGNGRPCAIEYASP